MCGYCGEEFHTDNCVDVDPDRVDIYQCDTCKGDGRTSPICNEHARLS